MKAVVLAAAAASMSLAAPVLAQDTRITPPSGNSNSIIRTPDSFPSSGAGAGTSGVGTPGPTYPGRLRDFNNPSTEFGPSNEFGIGNRPIAPPRR